MSYSRWSNSCWYTFCSSPEDKKDTYKKIAQVFSIMFEPKRTDSSVAFNFSYAEINKNKDKCVSKVKEELENKYKEYLPQSKYEELKNYMEIFIQSIDEKYLNEKNGEKYNGKSK